MYKNTLRPAWVEINLANLDYNIKQIIQKANGHEIIGVVKADSYGHGAIKCAEVLRKNGVRMFAVATLEEAIALRKSGAKESIIALGLMPGLYDDEIVKYDVTPLVCSSESALELSSAAQKAGKTADLFIAVDTGMGRIGYLADDADNAAADIKKIAALPNIKISGIISHMSTADEYDKSYSHEQEAKFKNFYEKISAAGIDIPIRTLANSAGIMELPDTLYDAVRPGIILYGCYPSGEVDQKELSIKPVMSVKAIIVYLKDVPAGFSVGYGRKFISKRPSKIATVDVGYADGYPRPYSSKAKVIVNGALCPVAGNICMDQCMIDVTDVPGVKLGDEVILMGTDGKNSVTSEDIAAATGTINYEICCGFGQRLPKVYVEK